MHTVKSAKVSVIVPVYNVEKYLRQCLDSLVGQTLHDLQIILVNDGSKDSSGQIIDEYAGKDPRILAIHKPNGGISSARNEGLKYVTGEYVTFVDSDDWIDADMYETMVNAAQSCDADIVSTAADLEQIQVHTEDIMRKQLLRGDVSMCNKLFKRSSVVYEGFSFDPGNVSIDIKACYELFLNCRCWVLVPKAFYNYRQDNVSYGRSGFSKRDLNCVVLTEQVANHAGTISEDLFHCAYNHVLHAKFDILNKVVLFGYKTPEDKAVFNSLKNQYIKDIRANHKRIQGSTYFSKNEKIQMAVIRYSFPLFRLIKQVYKHLFDTSCESIKC